MRFSLLVFLVVLSQTHPLHANTAVQSTFTGPVSLKVWKHWQASWNVENKSNDTANFELTRGKLNSHPYVTLQYKNVTSGLQARLKCESYVRTGEWSVTEKVGNSYTSAGRIVGQQNVFHFADTPECLDNLGENITTKIQFEVFSSNGTLLSYDLKPMYVRGKKSSYWKNKIDPYNAHAGSGQITIATSLAGESGWDKWDGTLVEPKMSFVDRNEMSSDLNIGLHRHEKNQELYFIESGKAVMLAGVAQRSGASYKSQRIWDQKGSVQETEEFQASGGWIESRVLEAGEVSVIVPNSQREDTVYFHGIEALSDLVFWTMGTKN